MSTLFRFRVADGATNVPDFALYPDAAHEETDFVVSFGLER